MGDRDCFLSSTLEPKVSLKGDRVRLLSISAPFPIPQVVDGRGRGVS